MENDDLKMNLEIKKESVSNKYEVCKVAARRLVSAHRELLEAEERKTVKNTPKSIEEYTLAESKFNLAASEYTALLRLYDLVVENAMLIYDELISKSDTKELQKIRSEAEKFENSQRFLRSKLEDAVSSVGGIEENTARSAKKDSSGEAYKNEEKSEELEKEANNLDKERNNMSDFGEKKEYYDHPEHPHHEQRHESHPHRPHHAYPHPHAMPYAAPVYALPHEYYYRPYPAQPGVNITPASIDISEIVEDAVATALEKFKAAFIKRADKFIEEMPVEETKTETVEEQKTVAPVLSSEAVKLEEQVLLGESEIIAKLSALMENIKKLSEEMTALGAAYIELAGVQHDAVDSQRRVNDMQRALSRELQGVQANQKVINQEQADVTGEQVALSEKQKANMENQKLLAETQSELMEKQAGVISAQNQLDESMREIIAAQKSITAAHQAIITSSNKTAELQRDLTNRQSELNSLQKSVMSEHKHLARTLRAKNKHLDKKETPAENDSAEISDEVLLDELKAEE